MRHTSRRSQTTLAAVLLGALILGACGDASEGDPASVEVYDSALDEEVDADDPAADDAADDAGDEPAPEPEVEPQTESDDPADAPASEDTPTPDRDALADPCAERQGQEDVSFIDLVSPVDDQVATGSVDIVGCANVFEATVSWMLLDGDGRTLDEGFTTAECGNGCVGAFEDSVPLDAAEEAGEPVVYLQVFSQNASDEGPEQLELTERIVVLG